MTSIREHLHEIMRTETEERDFDIDIPADHFSDRRPRILPSRPAIPSVEISVDTVIEARINDRKTMFAW